MLTAWGCFAWRLGHSAAQVGLRDVGPGERDGRGWGARLVLCRCGIGWARRTAGVALGTPDAPEVGSVADAAWGAGCGGLPRKSVRGTLTESDSLRVALTDPESNARDLRRRHGRARGASTQAEGAGRGREAGPAGDESGVRGP